MREETLAALRAASAEEAYLAALTHGRHLSPNDALADALADFDPRGGSV